jgi:chordin
LVPEPVSPLSAANPEQPQDMADEWTEEDVLNDGGCRFRDEVFENGALWHPRVEPHGEMKCINCRCKVSPDASMRVVC